MANNFAEIKQRVDFYIDDTMTTEIAILLFNQCNEDVSWLATFARTLEAEYDKEAPNVGLPPDFIEALELKIRKDNELDFVRIMPIGLVQPADTVTSAFAADIDGTTGYELFGDVIEIRAVKPHSGTLLLRYYAVLPTITALSEVPKLKARFHDLYALFAAAKYYQNYQDELNAKMDYWDEYQTKRQDLEREYYRVRTRSNAKTVYRYRGWS